MTIAALQAAYTSGAHKRLLTQAQLVAVETGEGDTVRVAPTPPEQLAAKAQLSLEVYSLARCIASEGYSGDKVGRAAAAVVIGQAIANGSRPRTITDKLTRSVYPKAAGLYGEQSGRYAATTRDPTAWHAMVASGVLSGGLTDLARGATMFLAPSVWVAGGEQAGKKLDDFADVMARWHSLGKYSGRGYGQATIGPIPTVNPGNLLVFRREHAESLRRQSHAACMRIFEQALDGKTRPAPGNPDTGLGPVLVGLAAFAAWWVF